MKDIQIETEARLTAAWQDQGFGPVGLSAHPGPPGRPPSAATAIEGDDARRRLNDLRPLVTDELRVGKNLTLVKAREIIDRHIAPLKLRHAADLLQKSIPGSGQSLRRGGGTRPNKSATPTPPSRPGGKGKALPTE